MGSIKRLIAIVGVLAIGVSIPASALDKALAEDGTLFTTRSYHNMFALRTITPDGTDGLTAIPNTAGYDIDAPLVRYIEATDTIVVAWLQRFEGHFNQLTFASYANGEWTGPIALFGDGLEPARNPSLLVHTDELILEDGEVFEATTAHLTWWNAGEAGLGQFAMHCSIPFNEDGTPDLEGIQSVPLRGMLGIRVICSTPSERSALTRPHLFHDGATGNPHVMFFEPDTCSMHIVEFGTELLKEGEIGFDADRRRTVPVLAHRKDIGLPIAVPPGEAAFSIGPRLTIVGHWDVGDKIEFIHMDEDGWSDVRHVQLGDDLDHEQALTLLRGLAK